ncbi:flagellar protein FlgN [Peredibacter sp. HCB2-198]|uniref:flagellar protein FlgN n=1 Tax=Peredibacter sp. HCB2-198 TaxID=3383025 RepID=UPI0038B54888
MDNRLNEKKLYFQRVLAVWEGFCQLHKELYDLTCEEYLTLLESDIDKLETMLPLKDEIISKIGELEKDRSELIDQLNHTGLFANKIVKASDLLASFAELDQQSAIPALKNLNSLLIDIVQKIQEQNKKNQQFLNKAMISLREIKQGFTGKKNYSTYGADGLTRSLNR